MRSSSSGEHVRRLANLEQEFDDLYGDLGLPKPKFGELSVRRLKPQDHAPPSEHRVTGSSFSSDRTR